MLPSSIHDEKLRIPQKFVCMFGPELSTVATLTVPDGRFWHVGLEKAGEKIWFYDGWKDFLKYYSIGYGYFVVFRYEGNSRFHVLIFGMSASEIQYPHLDNDEKMRHDNVTETPDSASLSPSHLAKSSSNLRAAKHRYEIRRKSIEVEDNAELTNGFTKSRQGILNTNVISTQTVSVKNEEDEKMFVIRKKPQTSPEVMMCNESERPVHVAKKSSTGNPYFVVTLSQYNLCNSVLYLPKKFVIQYLKGDRDQFIELQASNGKKGRVRLFLGKNASTWKLGKGWHRFSKDNNLKVGDVCVFELIEKKNAVLKVSTLRNSS